MIRPLRRVHRAAFVVLGLALPTLFIAGLSGRSEPAVNEVLPAGLVGKRLAFEGDWNQPDPLVYWSGQPADSGDALPADAILFGTVKEGAIVLSNPVPSGGQLLIYSLAKQEIVDRVDAHPRPRKR